MLKIYLVRHVQNKDNADGILNGHRDEPLTDLGFAQAHETAENWNGRANCLRPCSDSTQTVMFCS